MHYRRSYRRHGLPARLSFGFWPPPSSAKSLWLWLSRLQHQRFATPSTGESWRTCECGSPLTPSDPAFWRSAVRACSMGCARTAVVGRIRGLQFWSDGAWTGSSGGRIRSIVARWRATHRSDARSDAGNAPVGPDRNGFVPAVTYTWRDVEFLKDHQLAHAGVRTRLARGPGSPAYASRFPLLNHVFPVWMSATTAGSHLGIDHGRRLARSA